MPIGAALAPVFGLAGSQLATKVPPAFMYVSRTGQYWNAAKGFFPSGQFGIGYTGGAYAGYGITNTWDPFGIHKPKYKYYKQNIRMAYGMSGYGSYRRRYTRFRRYRRYGRYSRFSRYRRRPMYRRRRYY